MKMPMLTACPSPSSLDARGTLIARAPLRAWAAASIALGLLMVSVPPHAVAQSSVLPSTVGMDFGVSAGFPDVVTSSSCDDGLPMAGGVRVGWVVHPVVRVQATASRFGNANHASCGDIVPCEPDEPCTRREGLDESLTPVGVRALFEPRGSQVRVAPRIFAGAGRLIGDSETYGLVGAGLRLGDDSGPSLTLDLERLMFRSPVRVVEARTGELVSQSRESGALNLVRLGFEWGM